MPAGPIVTLLTDFGDADGFVGAMRGVIASRAPGCRMIDLAHHVPRGDVAKAGRVLARAVPYFPAGTVHCVVVDPGVGSARRAVAVRAGGMAFIAPDNGVLGPVLAALDGQAEARVISNRAAMRSEMSHTFHGRDLFAPAAAWLASGHAFTAIGPAAGPLVELPLAPVRRAGETIIGRIDEIDHYGNLISDIPAQGLPPKVVATVGDVCLTGPRPAYAAVPSGDLVLVVGSLGTLEIAVRDGSAAHRLGVAAGAPCIVEPAPAESGP